MSAIFLSPKQLAHEIWGQCEVSDYQIIIRLIRSNKIEAEKVGWNWIIPVSQVKKAKDLITNGAK